MLVDGRPARKEHLKVLDFGIAKIRGGLPRATSGPRPAPSWARPVVEPRADPAEQPFDARSDLYSVGVILYELLTGHRPFTGPIIRVIYHHVNTPPPSFAERNPNVAIPPEVEQVVMRCLAKDPDDRPQSPRELAEMFHQALGGTDTVVTPTPSGPSSMQIMPGTTPRSGSTVETSPRPLRIRPHLPGASSPADSEFEGDLPRPRPRDRTHPDVRRRLSSWLWLALSALAVPAFLIASLPRLRTSVIPALIDRYKERPPIAKGTVSVLPEDRERGRSSRNRSRHGIARATRSIPRAGRREEDGRKRC